MIPKKQSSALIGRSWYLKQFKIYEIKDNFNQISDKPLCIILTRVLQN